MIDYHSFHKLSYGLYIICSEFEGTKSGYTANTGFQVTSEPSTVAISCNKNNMSCDIIQKRKAFSLSVLQKDLDVGIIGNFGFNSGKDIDKFGKYKTKTGALGIPIVTECCVAAFECNVIQTVDVGTHMLFIGEVVEGEMLSENDALTYEYYHSFYKMRSPKNAPTYIDPALLEEPKEEIKEDSKEPVDSLGAEHICTICGYVYDPELGEPSMGIPPGTPFEDLPEDFECPICRATKEYFNAI